MIKYPNSEKYVRERLIPYRLCNRCWSHVLKNNVKDKPYQCMYCYDDLEEIETHEMKVKEEISDFDFEDLVEQTNALLCLDKE